MTNVRWLRLRALSSEVLAIEIRKRPLATLGSNAFSQSQQTTATPHNACGVVVFWASDCFGYQNENATCKSMRRLADWVLNGPGQRGGLAKEPGTEIANGWRRIYVVENVARISTESQAVALT